MVPKSNSAYRQAPDALDALAHREVRGKAVLTR